MPCHIYNMNADGSRQKINLLAAPAFKNLWYSLNEQANEMITAATFWEYMISSMLLLGDAFARIIRSSKYQLDILGFMPVHPNNVTVKSANGRLIYEVKQDGKTDIFDQSDIIHIPGLGFNGLRGMSQIKYVLKNAAGNAIATDEYTGAFFRQGAKTDTAIVLPGKADADQVATIKTSWKDARRNSSSFEPIVISGGATLQQLTLTAEDAQLIETRKMQTEEIARIFGVLPSMIGVPVASSVGTMEQTSIWFVKYTLQRILVKIEQELNRKCIYSDNVFIEFNTSGIERGDIKTRSESYRIGVGRAGEPGWLTVNEIRRYENLPPIDGGDILATWSNTNAAV